MSRADEQRAWEFQQAKNREQQRLHNLERNTAADVQARAKANGYSDHNATILAIAIGKLARRREGGTR